MNSSGVDDVQTLKSNSTNIGTLKVEKQRTSDTSMTYQSANATNVSLRALQPMVALVLNTSAVERVLGARLVLHCFSGRAQSLSGTLQGIGAMSDLMAVLLLFHTSMAWGPYRRSEALNPAAFASGSHLHQMMELSLKNGMM
mmetsp:Transcript_27434/g.44952  ORF Transcript_27434/g.44952 Transcript_27434/m.44952 type:complete len:142 (-) Transcript_27434:994-1419(-)